MMTVKKVTSADFTNEVLESDTPVVVDFYADWCGPCRRMAPVLEELAERWTPDVKVVKVDTEAQPQLAAAYGISSIPAFLLFRKGSVAAWTLGAKQADLLQRQLGIKRGPSSLGWLWGSLLWKFRSRARST